MMTSAILISKVQPCPTSEAGHEVGYEGGYVNFNFKKGCWLSSTLPDTSSFVAKSCCFKHLEIKEWLISCADQLH